VFQVPYTFTSSEAECPIDYATTSLYEGGSLSTPVEVSPGVYTVTPSDITRDDYIRFNIRVYAVGGAYNYFYLYFYVGC